MTVHAKSPGLRAPRRKRWALALVGVLLAAHAAADVDAPYSWEVTGPKARQFLVGSVRLIPGPEGAIPKGIQNMYGTAETLMVETDISALSAPEVQTGLMQLARSQVGLKAEVGAPLYAKLQTYLGLLRVPVEACKSVKPWFCALTLDVINYRRAGFASVDGLDEVLFTGAQQDGKNLRWLETPPENVELFSGMSDAQSKHLLQAALRDNAKIYVKEPKRMFQAWRKDDFAPIEKEVGDLKRDYPDLYARLLADRNRAWLPKLIQALDREETQLVVIDAEHLAGPDGVIALLRAHGYTLHPYSSLLQPQIETRIEPPLRAVNFRIRR